MFKKILYPVDFSTHSDAVADSIINLKPAGVEEVVALHVIDKRLFAQFPEVSTDVIETMKKSAADNLATLGEKFKSEGIRVDARIEMGVPFHQIVGVARSEAVSMIIMGSHGRSLVEEMLLGSTTENVLRHATVPILIEKFKTTTEGEKVILSRNHSNPFEKILFPTDFSDCSTSVVPYLKKLREAGTTDVVVTHVQDMTTLAPHLLEKLPEFEDIDTGRLSDIKNELVDAGIPNVKTVLKDGVPFTEIEALANEEDVGMIAIGSHGKSMVKEMLLGSVSGKIVRRSKRPILVIRRK